MPYFVACAAQAAPYTDNAFTDAVVEYGGIPSVFGLLIEESRVDQVGRLPLHRTVFFFRTGFKIYVTFYQCTIQAEAEVFHADEI